MILHTLHSDTRTSWLIVVLYTGLIFATLADVVLIMDVIERIVGDALNTILAILPLFLLALFLVYLIVVKRERQPWRYLLMIFIILSVALIQRFIYYPDEKVHLVEYGMLGWMIYQAVRTSGGGVAAGYVWTMVLVLIIGTADELVQAYLPMRVFDIRDIVINIHSGILGAVACSGLSYQLGDESPADTDAQANDITQDKNP
ncbi:MAG: VanZ family protein [Deltaproteobacteria bacterium]|nr:VanZ family protein [Candidatus Zymogenaceae bacterium]